MTDRIYVVAAKGAKSRLVRASHPSNAMRHVAAGTFTVAVASQDELVKLLGEGAKVEEIKAEQQQLPAT